MGQCYSVFMKLRFKDSNELLHKLIFAMKNTDCEWHTSEEEWERISLNEALAKFLYEIHFDSEDLSSEYKEISLHSDFDQSYGWESLMYELFEEITPCLEDDSYITVYPDHDYTHYVIKDKQCVLVH